MDTDTIFPFLTFGEQIVSKQSHRPCFSNVETIVILTNYRLLLRRKYIFCCCCNRSHYTAIALDSIDRLDDIPAYSSMRYIILMVLLFLVAIILIISGEKADVSVVTILGIIFMLSAAAGVTVSFFLRTFQWISIKGAFGGEAFVLERGAARELEGLLLEMCYQKQISPSNQAIPQVRQAGPASPPTYGATAYTDGSKQ